MFAYIGRFFAAYTEWCRRKLFPRWYSNWWCCVHTWRTVQQRTVVSQLRYTAFAKHSCSHSASVHSRSFRVRLQLQRWVLQLDQRPVRRVWLAAAHWQTWAIQHWSIWRLHNRYMDSFMFAANICEVFSAIKAMYKSIHKFKKAIYLYWQTLLSPRFVWTIVFATNLELE